LGESVSPTRQFADSPIPDHIVSSDCRASAAPDAGAHGAPVVAHDAPARRRSDHVQRSLVGVVTRRLRHPALLEQLVRDGPRQVQLGVRMVF